ncbi:hypothetical protein, partial [Paenibacillus xylanexedens]|uniref:hypothetical protein n=1 Tax=Paenibacillus xylanexedens TaxID=528191 RepID=UPI001C92BE5D
TAAQVLQNLFTPIVNTPIFFLITIQLTINFFKRIIAYTEFPPFDLPLPPFSLLIPFLLALIQLDAARKRANYAILIRI